MLFVKNPIFLAIVMSAIIFLILTYFCTEENDKNKKNKKKKKQDKLSRENIIVISVIAGLGTWYIVSCLSENKEGWNGKQENIQNGMKNQTGGGEAAAQKISEDSTRSYNLIGSGLNIPRSELKLPNVLIDYQ